MGWWKIGTSSEVKLWENDVCIDLADLSPLRQLGKLEYRILQPFFEQKSRRPGIPLPLDIGCGV